MSIIVAETTQKMSHELLQLIKDLRWKWVCLFHGGELRFYEAIKEQVNDSRPLHLPSGNKV